jgi:hypothetical protein
MKLSNIGLLGLSKKGLENVEINPADAVVTDEFNIPVGKNEGQNEDYKDYRVRAVERLVKLRVPFGSEANITSTMAKMFIKCVCPHCNRDMQYLSSSGNCSVNSATYKCNVCNTRLTISVSNENGIFIQPKE